MTKCWDDEIPWTHQLRFFDGIFCQLYPALLNWDLTIDQRDLTNDQWNLNGWPRPPNWQDRNDNVYLHSLTDAIATVVTTCLDHLWISIWHHSSTLRMIGDLNAIWPLILRLTSEKKIDLLWGDLRLPMAPTITSYASFVPQETDHLTMTIADVDNLKNTLVMSSMWISLHQLQRLHDLSSDPILDQTYIIPH